MMGQMTKYTADFSQNNPKHSHMIYSTNFNPEAPASMNLPLMQHRLNKYLTHEIVWGIWFSEKNIIICQYHSSLAFCWKILRENR